MSKSSASTGLIRPRRKSELVPEGRASSAERTQHGHPATLDTRHSTSETRLLFVTGTDTGVGKTLLTALLLCHLRQRGCSALALKPFSSGSRADARLLHSLQDGELSLDEINPFYFPEPLAPLAAARKHKQSIHLNDVLDHIRSIALHRLPAAAAKSKVSSTLLIEGIGGLLVPLGDGYTVLDLIRSLASTFHPPSSILLEVLVVSRNQLGTLNHTLLTVRSLQAALAGNTQHAAHSTLKLALMSPRFPDPSSASNPRLLSQFLGPVPLITIPFLGLRCCTSAAVRANAASLHRTLNRLV